MTAIELKRDQRLVFEDASALHALGVERLRDLSIGFGRGVESLIEYGYPDTDWARVRAVTSGLALDHVGVLIPSRFEDTRPFLEPVIGTVEAIHEAPSSMVKSRLEQRTGMELPVTIHLVQFTDHSIPRLEIFSVEVDRLASPDIRLEQFARGDDFHLAFRVPRGAEGETFERLRRSQMTEALSGAHFVTGEPTRYYQLGGEWNRIVELLWPAESKS